MHSWTLTLRAWGAAAILSALLGCGPAAGVRPVQPVMAGESPAATGGGTGTARAELQDRATCTARVGSFNIRLDTRADGTNAWPQRIGMVVDVLGTAEVWGLQEALPHQVEELARRMPHMQALWRTRDANPSRDESCPILFDRRVWSLDPADHGTFWLSEDPATPGSRSWDAALPRICTYARLVRRDDGRCGMYVFNVHLDHRGAVARRESARLVAERIRARAIADPVVVVGDFNAGPESDPLRALLAAGEPLTDAWRAANPGAPEQGTFNGWAAAADGPRIDFVLVSPQVRVESASIDAAQRQGRWPSDHLPVTALLRLDPRAHP